jgi:hypothetical protein
MHDDSLLAKGPLERYVGSWQGDVSVDGATVEPHSYTQSNTFAWVLDGRFVEERGTGTNGSSFIGLWSFDARAGRYRAHYFLAPTGDIVAITHDWTDHTQTFAGAADLGGGIQLLAEDRFIGRDAYEWSTTITDSTGKILTSATRGRDALASKIGPGRRGLIGDRLTRHEFQRNYPGPAPVRQVLFIIERRPTPGLCRHVHEIEGQNTRDPQLFLVRCASSLCSTRREPFDQCVEHPSFLRIIDQLASQTERNHGAVVHRVVERRAGEHQAIE